MANVRETRKIMVLPASPDENAKSEAHDNGPEHYDNGPEHHDNGLEHDAVEEAPVPALGGGLPVGEAIPLQASPVVLQIPDTVSVAASDDGHPKADTLSTFVREQVGTALPTPAPSRPSRCVCTFLSRGS